MTISATAPVPASATIDSDPKQTYSNQTWVSCDGDNSQKNSYGYQRCVTYQINDKNGDPIYQNFLIEETVTVIDPGNVNSKMNTGNSSSNPTGQFEDQLALIGTSALPSNACSIVRQSFVVSGNSSAIRVNCIQYGSADVTITDVTSNPSTCSKPTYHCN